VNRQVTIQAEGISDELVIELVREVMAATKSFTREEINNVGSRKGALHILANIALAANPLVSVFRYFDEVPDVISDAVKQVVEYGLTGEEVAA